MRKDIDIYSVEGNILAICGYSDDAIGYRWMQYSSAEWSYYSNEKWWVDLMYGMEKAIDDWITKKAMD